MNRHELFVFPIAITIAYASVIILAISITLGISWLIATIASHDRYERTDIMIALVSVFFIFVTILISIIL